MPHGRLPSLRALQAFEVFARVGSMTRAAEELHVSHGAVSKQIKTLERQLGSSLLVGPRHALALTPTGRELARSLSAAFDMIARSLPGTEIDKELVVSCFGTFAMKWLIPRLPRFLDRHPGVQVRIVESHAADFSQRRIHAGIRLQMGRAEHGLKGFGFLSHAYGPVVSPALFEAAQRDPAQLLWLPRLHSETFSSGWIRWASDVEVTLPPVSHEQAFEHNSYMLEAAIAGLGIAVTAWAFAQADIVEGRLIAPWGFRPLPTRFTYLQPALTENMIATNFGTWLRAEGRRDLKPPAAQLPLPNLPIGPIRGLDQGEVPSLARG